MDVTLEGYAQAAWSMAISTDDVSTNCKEIRFTGLRRDGNPMRIFLVSSHGFPNLWQGSKIFVEAQAERMRSSFTMRRENAQSLAREKTSATSSSN